MTGDAMTDDGTGTPHDGAGEALDAEALDAAQGGESSVLGPPDAPVIDFVKLRQQDARGPRGRWAVGNMARLTTGQRTKRLLDVPELARAHVERTDALVTDLGGIAGLSVAAAMLVAELARLQLVTESLGADVLRHGVLTGKGRTRAAVTIYLQVLDRQQKLAQLLGLERRQKPSGPTHLADYLEGQR